VKTYLPYLLTGLVESVRSIIDKGIRERSQSARSIQPVRFTDVLSATLVILKSSITGESASVIAKFSQLQVNSRILPDW
jgi:hypothetical protein